jgi:hypothetical protein
VGEPCALVKLKVEEESVRMALLVTTSVTGIEVAVEFCDVLMATVVV